MPYIQDCEITLHQVVASGHRRLVLHGPEIAQDALAGQFCMIQVQPGLYPFLRRPMCFERIYRDSFSILYKIEGEGTNLLAQLNPGQTLNVQGPLGKPFLLDPQYDHHILVAGGIGVAPFPALAEAIKEKLGKTPEVILAARAENMLLCEKEFHEMGCKVHLATDDGSAGKQAFAAGMLRELAPGPGAAAYACGPMIMMKTTHQACQDLGIPCFASLEANMACGDGVCLGCVVQSHEEKEGESMVRVCADGPVFDTAIINWDAY